MACYNSRKSNISLEIEFFKNHIEFEFKRFRVEN